MKYLLLIALGLVSACTKNVKNNQLDDLKSSIKNNDKALIELNCLLLLNNDIGFTGKTKTDRILQIEQFKLRCVKLVEKYQK